MNWQRQFHSFGIIALAAVLLGAWTPSLAVGQMDDAGPPRPVLPDDLAARVAELEEQIEALTKEENLEEAIALAQAVLDIREEHQTGWTDRLGHPAEWYEVADARRAVADLQRLPKLHGADRADLISLIGSDDRVEQLAEVGRNAEAQAIVERQLEIRRRALGDKHPDTLLSINNMGLFLQEQGGLAEAEPYYREALEGNRQVLGDEHPQTLESIGNMGYLLLAQGRPTETEPYYREDLEGKRRVLGDEHRDTLLSINNMGYLLQVQGKLGEAEAYLGAAMEGFRRVLGDDHPWTLFSINNVGAHLITQGRLADAELHLREALESRRGVLGDENPQTLQSINNMGMLLQAQGKSAQAEPYLREALDGYRRVLGEEHPDTLLSINNMGYFLQEQGRLAEAEPYTREALEGRRRVLGDDHQLTLLSISNMGYLLLAQGRTAETEPYYREALDGLRRVLGSEHPATVNAINNMGYLLQVQGKLAEAEPYYREAIEVRRRVQGDEHPHTLVSITNMGRLLLAQGELTAAEPYLREALQLAERLRTSIIGEERERAAYAETLGLTRIASGYASMLIGLGRAAEAFSVIERGRGRALLDLLERQSVDLVQEARQRAGGQAVALESALAAEQDARATVVEAESQVAALRKELDVHSTREDLGEDERATILVSFDKQMQKQLERVALARRETFEAGRRVLGELRGLVPDAHPLGTDEILDGLDDGELILSYAWTDDTAVLVTAGNGATDGLIIAEGKEAVHKLNEAVIDLRSAIAHRPVKLQADVPTSQLLASLVPDELRDHIDRARRLIILPGGPLHDIPFDVLWQHDSALAGKSVVYAASATIYINHKQTAAELERSVTPSALVVGDAIFDRGAPPEPDYPESGVLIAMVQDGSNAAEAGLQRGDVLLSYAGKDVAGFDALRQEIARVNHEVDSGGRPADDRFAVAYWRHGEQYESTLAPGRMGVRLEQRDVASALRSMTRLERGFDELSAEATAVDQVRLHGGRLAPLPGTAEEAQTIASIIEAAGGEAQLLLGEEATVTNVSALAKGRDILHLATHGLTGSADRPYEASLALTQPLRVSPDDIGFLRLEDLIRSWRGKLKECDLVVLSACDTQRGVRKGDSVMALPWGFFYAGAPTVIASLWKVDDVATSLMMGRLYENLLGQFDRARSVGGRTYAARSAMSKADALAEAKGWLRNLSGEEARRLVSAHSSGARGSFRPRPQREEESPSPRPYAHPYYWSAFVLIGSPQ